MRPGRVWTATALCLIGTACDIPTEVPIVEQRWMLPLDVVTMEQEELLPPEVTISGNAYDVDVADAAASETLGNVCGQCALLDGLTVPTPAYQGGFVSVDALPVDLLEADVLGGAVDIEITNGLSFDPLAGGGTLTITVAGASGGPVLGTLVFDGAVDALAPASVTTRTLFLGPGTVTGALETSVAMDHVGGVLTTIDASDQISMTATNASVQVASATVDVAGTTAELRPTLLDVEDVPTNVIDGIQTGSVTLEVVNPYGVAFDGTATIGPVVKNLQISAAASSTVEVVFSAAELQSFLGLPGVTFEGTGTVNGGPAVLTPTDELSVDTTLDLTVQLGS